MSFYILRLVRWQRLDPVEVIQLGDNEEDDLEQGQQRSQQQNPKPRILVEQPDGQIMLGEDPLLVQISEEHPFLSQRHISSNNSPPSQDGQRQLQYYEEQVTHAQIQYRMRRNAFLLMLALDLLYLTFAAVISFRNVAESDGNRYVSENASFIQTLLLVGRGSPSIILFAASVDILGAAACFLYKPGLIAIYVILMSCILAVDAFTGLGPLLVVRVLLIFMAFRIRKAMFIVLQEQELLRIHTEREARLRRVREAALVAEQDNNSNNQENSLGNANNDQNSEQQQQDTVIIENNSGDGVENQDQNSQNNNINSNVGQIEERQQEDGSTPSRILVRQNAFRIRG